MLQCVVWEIQSDISEKLTASSVRKYTFDLKSFESRKASDFVPVLPSMVQDQAMVPCFLQFHHYSHSETTNHHPDNENISLQYLNYTK